MEIPRRTRPWSHHRSLVDYLAQVRNGKIYPIQFHCTIFYLIQVYQTPLKIFVHKSADLGRYMSEFGVTFHKQSSLNYECSIVNVTFQFFVNFSTLLTAGSHSGSTQPKYSNGTLFHRFSKELFFLLFYMMFTIFRKFVFFSVQQKTHCQLSQTVL